MTNISTERTGTGDQPANEEVGEQNDVRTSVIAPVYEEEGNVRPLAEELLTVFDSESGHPHGPYEIVFVDDGSTDGTREALCELATESERIRVGLLRRNFGQSAALAAGIDLAAGDRIVTIDADRQNDPTDIPRLLDELETGYDCVNGWRRDRTDPLRKRVPSAVMTRLVWVTGPDLHDYVCGIAAYRAEAIREIPLYGEGHRYIPSMLADRGYRVVELPVNHRPRRTGRTKYGPRRLVRGFVDLLFQAYWVRFSDRPMHFFGGAATTAVAGGLPFAAAVVVVGVLVGGTDLLDWIVLGTVVAALVVVVATILFVAGLYAESETRRHYQEARPYHVERVVGGSPDGENWTNAVRTPDPDDTVVREEEHEA